MFEIIKLNRIPEKYDEYSDGTFLLIGDDDGLIVYIVYTMDGSTKSVYSIPKEVFYTLYNRYSKQNPNIEILKELAGKYSADDIIKFKTNKMI